jgi:hypothetical protein
VDFFCPLLRATPGFPKPWPAPEPVRGRKIPLFEVEKSESGIAGASSGASGWTPVIKKNPTAGLHNPAC